MPNALTRPWYGEPLRPGRRGGEIVSAAPLWPQWRYSDYERGHADVAYYGGYLVAESIPSVPARDRLIACYNACAGVVLPSDEHGSVATLIRGLAALEPFNAAHFRRFATDEYRDAFRLARRALRKYGVAVTDAVDPRVDDA